MNNKKEKDMYYVREDELVPTFKESQKKKDSELFILDGQQQCS